MEIPRHVIKTTSPSSTSLPRTHGSPDLTKLSEPAAPISLSGSETSSSRSSQFLYMKDNKQTRRALSSLINGSEHNLEGQPERMETLSAAEEIAWNIVDQEIFEWQYACHTGRPYWWAPESRYTGVKKVQPRPFNEPSPQIWMGDIIDEYWKPSYSQQRRAVSEGFAQDTHTSDELAHLVAIQLLGSCFTLPPDYIAGAPSPDYSMWDGKGVVLPDPRMISSLRMHSHFRYSPSFGHQARNASPVTMWMSFDGSCPQHLEPKRRDTRTFAGRQQGIQRNEMVRESSDSGSLDDTIERASRSETEYSTNGLETHPTAQHTQDTIGRSRPTLNFIRHESLQAEFDSSDEEETEPDSNAATASPKSFRSDHRFHSVRRSEPHHVFVQPVKELVVKRWRTFKNRLGHSSRGNKRSEDRSESSQSTCSSVGTTNDGRSRRRRAQEDSEIDGSMDSIVHLNSPATGQVTPSVPNTDSSHLVVSRNPTFQFQLADPLVAAAELVAALSTAQYQKLQQPFEGHGDHPAQEAILPSDAHLDHNDITTTENAPRLAEGPRTSSKQPSATRSYSTRRNKSRKRRKSMLSEVYTVDEYDETVPENGEASSPHTVGGSILSPPPEGVEPLSPIHQQNSWLDTSISPDSIPAERLDRPAFCRLSTSGTQIFTPSRDGIELDGLPVGPTKDAWDEENGGERTYL